MPLRQTLTALGLCWSLSWVPALAQVRIGMPSGFTGSVAAGVKENLEGAQLLLDAVNQRGGIHGQKVELLQADDGFDPKRTAQVATDLIERQGVVALFLNRGTPHSQALLPLLAERKVPLVAPSTGAMLLHEPVHPWVFNVRATYQREAARAVEHLAGLGVSRMVIWQTDDSFGADASAGAATGLEKVGLKAHALEKFPREKADFGPLAAQATKDGVQAVLIFGSAGNTATAIRALREAGSKAQVVTLSNNASQGFVKLLGEHARGVIVTQVFPSERSAAYPINREASELAKAKGLPSLSPAMMEGFAAAKVLVEGLKRAGPNPTGAKLREALEGIKNLDLGGLTLGYGPTDHTGLEFADLSIVDGSGQFRR